MTKPLKVSLVISTYNAPRYLACCLASVLQQTYAPHEVVIADDGSGEETKQVVEQFKTQAPFPVIHIWHPDNGFQLAAIRNKAFVAASGEYLINIDGDLILNKHFIKDHIAFAKERTFISAGRSSISKGITPEALSNPGKQFSFFTKGLTDRLYAFRSYGWAMIASIFVFTKRPYLYVLGCNMSFWKRDLEKVNGYNEEFIGWGKEDNDLCARLINAGIRLQKLRFAAIVYHLEHGENERDAVSKNEKLLEKSVKEKLTYVSKGMLTK